MDEVLVIGGRTTGLMMAAELARRNVPTRCIDASPGIDPHVRANLLHSRTLEILQGLGLDGPVTEGSVPERGFVFYRDGARVGESPHGRAESPFPYGLSQSQAHTEAILQAHLKGLGVEVERGVALTGLVQDDGGITVTLQREGQPEETARAHWVIGCDGAHSAVRRLIGAPFPGDADAIPYMLGDVLIEGDEELEPDRGHVFLHGSGELYAFTRLPGNRHFLVATLPPGAGADDAPTLEDLQRIVAERAWPALRLSDPCWLGCFRISYRLVPFYRKGRAFLAGDAAHIHSLLAGHGMNTGLQDAHNLAWKLALVAGGQAGERAGAELLASYETERRAVAREVVDATRQMTETLERYGGLTEAERGSFIAQMFTPEPARAEAARHLQEIDLDYGASPLCLPSDGTFLGGPVPGTRAPDADGLLVAGRSTSLFRLPADAQYRLLLFCGTDEGAPLSEIAAAAEDARRYAGWVTPYIVSRATDVAAFGTHRVIIDPGGRLHDIYAARGACLYLIRPDGYVAYRSTALSGVGTYFESLDLPAG